MPEMIVRRMQEADTEGYLDVRSLTYFNGDPIPEDRRVNKYSEPYTAVHEGKVKGTFNILNLTCTRGPALLKCSGVAGVAVLPHERRLGVGQTMMKYWVRQSRELGIEMASLYAFSDKYYRQFGYEVCGKRLKITCPTDRLPKIQSRLPLRRLKPEDWQELDPCFSQFAHSRSGLSLRSDLLWQRILSENRPLTIYAAGDPVVGYAVVSHNVEFDVVDHISDIGWSTGDGYRAVIEILRSIAINKSGLSWYEPSDSPFLAQFLDTKMQVEITRPIMFRVCDVPAALRKLVATEPCEFTIQVHDELIEENSHCWIVRGTQRGTEVEKCEGAEISMDIRQFAQALLGDPSLKDLARNGLLTAASEHAIKEAGKLLPPSPVYCPEFF